MGNKWLLTIDGAKLRQAIKEERKADIISEIESICKKVITVTIYDVIKQEFEEFLNEEVAFRDEEDDDEVIDLFLDEFYDLCDRNKVWISLGIKGIKGEV